MIQIQLRRGTAVQWSTANPILALAEVGLEIDTDQFKIGNGIDPWNLLPYGGIQGPIGPMGPPGDNYFQKIVTSVPALTTLAVDTALLSSFKTGDYIISFHNPTLARTKSFKLLVNNDDTGISDQVYGMTGDIIDTAISAAESGLNFLLNVTNNEASAMNVVIVRTLL